MEGGISVPPFFFVRLGSTPRLIGRTKPAGASLASRPTIAHCQISLAPGWLWTPWRALDCSKAAPAPLRFALRCFEPVRSRRGPTHTKAAQARHTMIDKSLPLQTVNSFANGILRKTQSAARMKFTSPQGAAMNASQTRTRPLTHEDNWRRQDRIWRSVSLIIIFAFWVLIAVSMSKEFGSFEAMMRAVMDNPQTTALVLLMPVVYLLPMHVALWLRSKNTLSITVLNVLLGWTGLFWIVSLIDAFRNSRQLEW